MRTYKTFSIILLIISESIILKYYIKNGLFGSERIIKKTICLISSEGIKVTQKITLVFLNKNFYFLIYVFVVDAKMFSKY